MRACTVLGAGLAVVALHALMLRVAAEWSFVAALLSPGAHSGAVPLMFGLGFLSLRLLVYVALPTLGATSAVFLGVSWAGRRISRLRNSPTSPPGPMLSAPDRDPEVTDGDAS